MVTLRFDERVVVVTGAGQGIGRAHARHLASLGARVVVADLKGGGPEGTADDVVADIVAGGGEAMACYGSVAEEAGAAAIVQTAIDAFGRVDAVVNNAGIADHGSFDELSIEQFRRVLDVHYFGALHVTRAAWPHFKQAGYGRVVNTVSESMLGGFPRQTNYAAAKGALFGLTKSLSTEAEPLGIKVNAIAPRALTPMSLRGSFKTASPEQITQAKVMLAPELNSPAVAFLAHESCPLNGEILRTGMGSIARLAVVHTKGFTVPSVTIDDIAEHLDEILEVADGTVTSTRPMMPG